jgi:response regulator RpfG family c-di-GMP phosphodiesterase
MLIQAGTPSAGVTVVDDDPAARDVLLRAARSWQYECQAADSAEEALRLLERRPTPLVLTDLRMPGQGGVWLVQEVRRRWPDTAVLVVTAGDDGEAALECLRLGASHYFLKPIKLEELRHALEMSWRAYQLQQENDCYRRHLERLVCRETRRVRRTFLSAIDSLVRTLEERDPYTAGHSARVRRCAALLGRAVGLGRRERRQLALAAKLHDIGKLGVADAVLNKRGPLDDDERRQVEEHPVIGERILSPVIRCRPVLAAIRGHHERLDGRGYPDGLRGSQVPLLARLLSVADCFDALTSTRAYRDALSVAEALDVLRAGAGTQFEPEFVRAFVEVTESRPVGGAGPR